MTRKIQIQTFKKSGKSWILDTTEVFEASTSVKHWQSWQLLDESFGAITKLTLSGEPAHMHTYETIHGRDKTVYTIVF